MSQPASRRRSDPREEIAAWMRQRTAEVAARVSPEARALGHQIYKGAIRAGVAIPLTTPLAVARAGVKLMAASRGSPAASPAKPATPVKRATPPPAKSPAPGRAPPRVPFQLQPLASSFAAGARGASDAITFGLGDHVSSGLSAAGGLLQGEDFLQGYHRQMAIERAQDDEDWRRHPYARTAGAVAGTGISLAAASPLALGRVAAGGARLAALSEVSRLKGAAGLMGREFAALSGYGAATGAGGQIAMDSALGRRSSPSDVLGAAIGGGVGTGGLLLSRQPQASAALGGAVTSAAQDLGAGRPVSLDEAAQGAAFSSAVNGLVAPVVATRVNQLKPNAKGKLGESLSETRSRLRGDAPREGGKPRVPVGGGKVTIPDHQTQSGLYVEAKFGPSASLSKNQTAAFSMDPDGFRLDHFLPQDVGAAAAAMASNSVMTAPRPVAKREGSSTKTKRKGS
jgi:hypothetical protein